MSQTSPNSTQFSPGALIQARGREWMVLNQEDEDTLRVRPITGSEEDQTLIALSLESTPVTTARFPMPNPRSLGNHETATLLRDALLLSLRRGAGPFRCFAQISVEPRAYQLVPLMMALKQDTPRLLIADDVGIGKTIEAGLIVRELLDRGEIDRFAVLCPPHLVDQWVSELNRHFHLQTVAITASGATKLERGLPAGASIFSVYPFTVVSLDYIKSDKRRDEFVRACPEFVIVDEAHTCTMKGQGRHKRFELLKDLANDTDRAMILLTATPHSGDEDAFYNLLGLLHPDFAKLRELQTDAREKLRLRLARHFVQRRRPDIEAWKDQSTFPKRETTDHTYSLDGEWEQFFESVLTYCHEVVLQAGDDEAKQRLNFWGTLALLRCASSSPAAAVKALKTRAGLDETNFEESGLEAQVFDGSFDELGQDDTEPSTPFTTVKLNGLIAAAEKLSGSKGDPKLLALKKHLNSLIAEGFSPVVFCRYIATAHYLHDALKDSYKKTRVDVITGELNSEERRARVESMGQSVDDDEQRLLIATDCLSEGINLQAYFNAVIHYDLSWNPTRHEQREGRVDRFGQKARVVRATLMYGANNPVDGAVLQVILRKAEAIQKNLGVPVPLPDDQHKLTQALMKAVLIRDFKKTHEENKQASFDFLHTPESIAFDTSWKDIAESAKKSRTVFAQASLKPSEVLPEWEKSIRAIGTDHDVERFATRALMRLGAAPTKSAHGYRLHHTGLPPELHERFDLEGILDKSRISFQVTPQVGYQPVTRSHPIIHLLAEYLLENTLKENNDDKSLKQSTTTPSELGRMAVWVSGEVTKKTTIVLLRLRHQLTTFSRAKGKKSQVVEETTTVGWSGRSPDEWIDEVSSLQILAKPPIGTPPENTIHTAIADALSTVHSIQERLNQFATDRARELLADHKRTLDAAGKGAGVAEVQAILPPDVIGIFILLPKA